MYITPRAINRYTIVIIKQTETYFPNSVMLDRAKITQK